MKRYLLPLFALLIASPHPAPAPDGVGNGGTTGRKLVSFALLGMEKYLKLCVGSTRCGLTGEERKLVDKVLESLKRKPAAERQLLFVTTASGIFNLRGRQHPAVDAATGDEEGSPIYINVDRLAYKGAGGLEERIDLPSAVALLFDELAHQVDRRFKDPLEHAKLDQLAGKLRLFLVGVVTQIDWKPDWSDITATVVAESEQDPFAELLVADADRLDDLSAPVRAVLRCPYPQETLTGLSLRNLHWHEGTWDEHGPHYVPFRAPLHAWAALRCERPTAYLPGGRMVTYHRRHLLVTLRLDALYQGEKIVGWKLASEEYRKPKLEMLECGETKSSPDCH